MVIECCGLPGSGKTYFCTKYSKEKKIFYYSKFRYSIIGKFVFKLKFFFFCKGKKVNDEVCKILSNIGNMHQKKEIKGIKNYILHFFYYRSIYIKLNKKNKQWIFDEGLVQILVFMIYYFNLPLHIFNIFFEYFKNLDIFYYWFNIDFNTIKTNIKKRNRHVCQVDELSDDELDELFLNVFPILNYAYNMLPLNRKKEVK